MSIRDPLEDIAIAGTANVGSLPAASHPADAAVAETDAIETVVLRRAGARAICERAGRMPSVCLEALPPCPADATRTLPETLGRVIRDAVFAAPPDSRTVDLAEEIFGQMAELGLSLPRVCLAPALRTTSKRMRQVVRPILGPRGRWLAALMPGAEWATSSFDGSSDNDSPTETDDVLSERFRHGSNDERIAAWLTLRRRDPTAARDRLAEGFAKEKPADRAAWVSRMRDGLSESDRSFLAKAVGDRSKPVGAAARLLLAELPGDPLRERMTARADAMLAIETVDGTPTLIASPPDELPNDWAADGIDAKPPERNARGQRCGKRAHWLASVLRLVPLAHNESTFGRTPAEIVALPREHTFADDLLDAWGDRLLFELDDPDAGDATHLTEWTEAISREYLAVAASERADRHVELSCDRVGELLPRLPPDRRDRLMTRVLALGGQLNTVGPMFAILGSLPRPWPEPLAREIICTARGHIARRSDYLAGRWAELLAGNALMLPVATLEEAIAAWTIAPAEPGHAGFVAGLIERTLAELTQSLVLRQTIRDELRDTQTIL